MRLWSLCPSYLDTKGLGSLWNEGIRAIRIIERHNYCGTPYHKIGYGTHPQLERFKQWSVWNNDETIEALRVYMLYVYHESCKRGFNFNKSLIGLPSNSFNETIIDAKCCRMVSVGQVYYEARHLCRKLSTERSKDSLDKLEKLISMINTSQSSNSLIKLNPLLSYDMTNKNTEDWERNE